MRIRASLFLVGVLLLCSLLRSVDVSAQEGVTSVQDEANSERQSRVAPAFSLPDLRGKKTESSALQNSVVVLDFWATWCVPCVGEIPAFNQLQEKYSRQGVKVIGLAVQS